LTVGVYFPIEAFEGPEPAMLDQIELAQRAERLGFAAVWARDVPLNDPSFGDLGQIYDPFVWLATIAARTSAIALATGAVILPLHHPIDVAKAAASLDHLSGGRFVFGVASGDRPVEYPAYGCDASLR
ncbi:LLM class flavin-dependent oxidoreductase, partial [Staphylococcus aureus]|uniref:LLM class flavin-dependent oxidoreductase n=1 Tax=Staphylococcus aureus TaxID=1280 RepID=UPI001B328D66